MKEKPVEELNQCREVHAIAATGWDTLTVTDLGESASLLQVSEDGTVHNIVISIEQAEAAIGQLRRIVNR